MKKLEDDPDWRGLMQLFCDVQNPEMMSQVLHLFLTMGERETIVGRYKIIRALLNGTMSQREISEQLNQSISKITLGSKAVQIISDELKSFLQKEMKKKANR